MTFFFILQAHQYACELEMIARDEAQYDLAFRFDEKRRKKRGFNAFVYSVQTEKVVYIL